MHKCMCKILASPTLFLFPRVNWLNIFKVVLITLFTRFISVLNYLFAMIVCRLSVVSRQYHNFLTMRL